MSLRRIAAGLFGLAVLLIVAGAVGLISARFGTYAIVLAVAVLAIGLASTDIGLIPVMAFPATLLMMRAGPLSVSDVVLAAATLPAVILYNTAEAEDMRPLIWLGVIYQAALLPGLLLNPYADNVQEWMHELFLVLGSLIVGWVVGRRGQAASALNLYLFGCVILAACAIGFGIYFFGRSGTFGPVSLGLYFHKNFIGNALAYALLMVFVRPAWLGWGRKTCFALMLLFAGGIAASNSRQAILSVFIAILILSLRSRQGGGGRGRLLLLALIPGVWYVSKTLHEQIQAGDPFNSAGQRLVWFVKSVEIWQQSPVFGVGLRWWYSDRFDVHFQPPNAFFEMLTCAGVVGLIAFIVLCAGGLWAVFRLDPRYGNIALAVMIARFCQGQLDLYWVAGNSSMLWLMAGLAFGAHALEQPRGMTVVPEVESRWQAMLGHKSGPIR